MSLKYSNKCCLGMFFLLLLSIFGFLEFNTFSSSFRATRILQYTEVDAHDKDSISPNIIGKSIGKKVSPIITILSMNNALNSSFSTIIAVEKQNKKRFQFDSDFVFPSFYNMSEIQMKEYFTDYELTSIVNKTCPLRNKTIHYFNEQNCCVGIYSKPHNGNKWNPESPCVLNKSYTFKLKYPHNRTAYNMGDVFLLLKNRSTVLISGDSIQHQLFEGMTCDLLRNNITLLNITDLNMDLLVEDWKETDAVIHGNRLYKLDSIKRHNRTFIARKLIADNVTVTHMINVLYIRSYRPTLQHYKSYCKWADVYLLNWDLHYSIGNRRSKTYRAWIKDIGNGMLKIFEDCFKTHEKKQQKLPIIIWRGTAAQHFHNVGGYHESIARYPKVNQFEKEHLLSSIDGELLNSSLLPHEHSCFPLHFVNETKENYLWRERLINSVKNYEYEMQVAYPNKEIEAHLNENDSYFLYYIPFKEVTNRFWWLHYKNDCSHYCSAPNLWEFVWDEMYRIIDSQY